MVGALAALLAALRLSPGVPPRGLPRRAAWRCSSCRGRRCCGRRPPELPLVSLVGAPASFVEAIDARGRRRACPGAAIVGGVLAAGVVLRLLWLGVGLRAAVAADAPAARRPRRPTRSTRSRPSSARGARVALRARPRAAGHLRRRARGRAAAGRAARRVARSSGRAVLCHELLHVRRRDWPWVLVEEAVLALLWFHPAVWWLVGELQLAREQVVDRLTVAATGARRAYMDALFSAADAPSAPPLLAGFLRRRHLARRLVALAEEVVMSRVRLAVGGVLVLGVLLGSGAAAVAAWPLAVAQVPASATARPPRAAVDRRGRAADDRRPRRPVAGADAARRSCSIWSSTRRARSRRCARCRSRCATTPTGLSVSATDLHKRSRRCCVRSPRQHGRRRVAAAVRRRRRDRPRSGPDAEGGVVGAAAVAVRAARGGAGHRPASSAQFDLTHGRVTAGPVQPLSGFAGAADPSSTFVARPRRAPSRRRHAARRRRHQAADEDRQRRRRSIRRRRRTRRCRAWSSSRRSSTRPAP